MGGWRSASNRAARFRSGLQPLGINYAGSLDHHAARPYASRAPRTTKTKIVRRIHPCYTGDEPMICALLINAKRPTVNSARCCSSAAQRTMEDLLKDTVIWILNKLWNRCSEEDRIEPKMHTIKILKNAVKALIMPVCCVSDLHCSNSR